MNTKKKFGISHTMSCLWAGQTLMRIRMDAQLAQETLRGHVVDIGGGRHPDYFRYFGQTDDVRIEAIDGSLSGIDFEKDALPFSSATVDTVLLCNVLEHIYNYRFLLGEIVRIMRPDGQLIGFVPFWVGYHPDPHDYFRYTREALPRIFEDAGFTDVRVQRIGGGPILANFNTIVLSPPRILRPILYLLYAPLDALFVRLRPQSRERNPLGFVFAASPSRRVSP